MSKYSKLSIECNNYVQDLSRQFNEDKYVVFLIDKGTDHVENKNIYIVYQKQKIEQLYRRISDLIAYDMAQKYDADCDMTSARIRQAGYSLGYLSKSIVS